MLPLGLQIGGTLLGGLFSSRGARAQRRSAEQANALAGQRFQQTSQNMQPFMGAGTNALARMQAVDGGDFSGFENSPDFIFARDQAMRAQDRSASARGSLFSGGTEADRMQMASGLASQNLGNFMNRQQGMAGMGLNAATSLGQFGQNATGQQMGAMGAAGSARAAGFGAMGDTLNGLGMIGGNFFGGRGMGGSVGRPDIPLQPVPRMNMPVRF